MTSSIEEIDCIEELRRKMDESEDFEFRRVVRAKIRKLKKEQETSDEGRNVTTVYPHSYLKQQNNNKNNNNNNNNNNKNINKNNDIKTSEKKNNTNDKNNNNNTSNNNCNKTTTTTKTNKLIAGNLCNADKRKSDFKSTETNVVEGASKKNECSRNQIDSSEVEATDIAGENKSDTKTNAGDTNSTTNNNERKDDGTNNNKDNNKNKDNNNNKDKNVNKDNNSITTTTTTSSNSDGSKRYDISNKNNVTNKTIATNNPNIDNNKDNDNISNIKTSLKKTSNTNNNIKTNNNNINNNIKTNNNNNNTDNKPEFGKVVLKKLNKETSTPDTPSNKRTQNLTARQALKMFKSMDKENNGSKVRGGAGFCGNTAPKEATIRDKMLTWCRNRLGGYEHISIKDFSSSWNDGMAFCALANSYFPHLFDYDLLKPSDKRHNFTLAFSTFRDEADIPQLLEVDDMLVTSYPDWKCIFTYVNSVVARMQELKKEREIDGVVD